jgi:uncharacterized protein YciI
VIYESADRVRARAPAHHADHVAHYQPFAERGELLMIGTFADPRQDGSMALFTTRDAAERFVAGDPFVRHGVVRAWKILEWNEVLRPGV